MKSCRIEKNMTVVINGKGHSPETGVFMLDDESARLLAGSGTLVIEDDSDLESLVEEVEPGTVDSKILVEPVEAPPEFVDLSSVPGVSEDLMAALVEIGIYTAEALAGADAETIMRINGVGSKRARRLIEAARKAVGQ